MAHSLIMVIKAVWGIEDEALHVFNLYFPRATLLLNTYNGVAAAEKLADKANKRNPDYNRILSKSGIFSYFTPESALYSRFIKIFTSDNLNEWVIVRIKEQVTLLMVMNLELSLSQANLSTESRNQWKLMELLPWNNLAIEWPIQGKNRFFRPTMRA